MPTAVVIQHVAFEDLGSLHDVLADHGYAIETRHATTGWDARARDADLLVVLGGPISVNDVSDFPFLADAVAHLADRLHADLPTLGICLGAQLMARALGARVEPGPRVEIGWTPITLTAAGRESALRHLTPDTPVFHWHGEVFSLPVGAVSLASTPYCQHQAFQWRQRALGLQFHPEATAAGLESWYIGNCHELADRRLSIAELRAAAAHHAPALERAARRCFDEYLTTATET